MMPRCPVCSSKIPVRKLFSLGVHDIILCHKCGSRLIAKIGKLILFYAIITFSSFLLVTYYFQKGFNLESLIVTLVYLLVMWTIYLFALGFKKID